METTGLWMLLAVAIVLLGSGLPAYAVLMGVSALAAPGPGRPMIGPPCTRSPSVATVARSASPTPSDPPSARTGMVRRFAPRTFARAKPSALKFSRYQAKPARIAPGAEYWRVYSSSAAGSIA